MAPWHAFDPQTFLAKVGAGRTLVACPKRGPFFTQGDAAEVLIRYYFDYEVARI
jgi:hypothetical protein